LDGDDVTMTIKGNVHTYQHKAKYSELLTQDTLTIATDISAGYAYNMCVEHRLNCGSTDYIAFTIYKIPAKHNNTIKSGRLTCNYCCCTINDKFVETQLHYKVGQQSTEEGMVETKTVCKGFIYCNSCAELPDVNTSKCPHCFQNVATSANFKHTRVKVEKKKAIVYNQKKKGKAVELNEDGYDYIVNKDGDNYEVLVPFVGKKRVRVFKVTSDEFKIFTTRTWRTIVDEYKYEDFTVDLQILLKTIRTTFSSTKFDINTTTEEMAKLLLADTSASSLPPRLIPQVVLYVYKQQLALLMGLTEIKNSLLLTTINDFYHQKFDSEKIGFFRKLLTVWRYNQHNTQFVENETKNQREGELLYQFGKLFLVDPNLEKRA